MRPWHKTKEKFPPDNEPVKVRFYEHGILGGKIHEDIFIFSGDSWYEEPPFPSAENPKCPDPCVWPIEWRFLTEADKK